MSDAWNDLSEPAWVEETGLAIVHQGEVVIPAPGSAARFAQLGADMYPSVEYHFPVEVVVRSISPREDRATADGGLTPIAHHLQNG